tara:strand:- start:126 stop:896 length:771 start_codon:yes stop_codon:yes gene_type:complete
MIKSVVMFSSGISSWAAGKRYAEEHGTEGMVLLFADTLIEDDDNYRFLNEAAVNIGCEVTTLTDGRNPFEIMKQRRIIGNSRIDPCSDVLKRKLLHKWQAENCDKNTPIIFGLSWEEMNRSERLKARAPEWNYVTPLCDAPYITKNDQLAWAKSEGIMPPRLYEMGFPHANCGGFCIKAGQANFKLLLKNFPERYAEAEEWELGMQDYLECENTILRTTVNNERVNLSLKQLREKIESEEPIDEFDFGGCACALPV